jgi:hypothetical protein
MDMLGDNIHTVEEDAEMLTHTRKEVCLETDVEKTECTL